MFRHAAKRLASLFLAGAMLTQLTLPAATLTVSAGEVLAECSFDYKIAPWKAVAVSPAKMNVALDEGAMHVDILCSRGGEGERYDLQVLYKNLHFKAKHRYKVSFRAKARRADMILCSAIYRNGEQNEELFVLDGESGDMHMGPYMGGNWFRSPVRLTTEYQTYEGIFTPTEDLDRAEWSFQFADGTEYAGNAIDGDEIWFDDMSIECLTCDDCNADPNASCGMTDRDRSGLADNYISVNQLGYFPQHAKIATLSDNGGDFYAGATKISLSGSYAFEIVDAASETVVYTGTTGTAKADSDSGDRVCKIDFTDFQKPGTYYIRIQDEKWRSFPFQISNSIYSGEGHDLLTDAMNYFYQNRSGSDLNAAFITSGEPSELAHAANRNESTGVVADQWYIDRTFKATDLLNDNASTIDTKGGWCSGANFDKNMTEGGITVWTLQNLYERSLLSGKAEKKFADGSGTVVIPENGNDYPDLLDECRYELDFMAKMKVQPDEKAWGSLAGLYYHKLLGVGFDALEKDYEHEAHSVYLVQPPTFAATLNYAACAAQGARLWTPYDAAYAAELLQSAKDAYQAFKFYYYEPDLTNATNSYDNPCVREELNEKSQYAPHSMINGVEFFSDTDVTDDAYWAACELFISASELGDLTDQDAASYLADLSSYSKAFIVSERVCGGDNETGEGTLSCFNWGNTASAGSLSLALHTHLLSAEEKRTLKESIIQTAETYIYHESQQGYSTPYTYDGAGYPLYAIEPLEVLRGYEKNSNVLMLSNLIAAAYAYDLTGSERYFSCVTAGMDYLLGNNPMAFSFITGYGTYTAENPVHRYWQKEIEPELPKAPDGVLVSGPDAGLLDNYMRSLGFTYHIDYGTGLLPSQRYYADSVEATTRNAASLSANASLAWVVSFLQDQYSDNSPSGDINGDGYTDTADVEMLLSYLLCKGDITVPHAADMDHDGHLNAVDLTLLKRMLLRNKK